MSTITEAISRCSRVVLIAEEHSKQTLQKCICTFAISLQLLPASLICFSLSSSAGVHGVLVRLFFSFGSCAETSTLADCGAELFACATAPPVEPAMFSGGRFNVTDLRFRFAVGINGGSGRGDDDDDDDGGGGGGGALLCDS
jgi:hypothetical protein